MRDSSSGKAMASKPINRSSILLSRANTVTTVAVECGRNAAVGNLGRNADAVCRITQSQSVRVRKTLAGERHTGSPKRIV